MADDATDIMFTEKDLGKKLYRKKKYYNLVIEQECLANSRAEATEKLSDCGIDHSQINHEITETKNGVVTYMVDANYTDNGPTENYGEVVYAEDEFAEENGDVEIGESLELLREEESPMKDYKDNVLTEG